MTPLFSLPASTIVDKVVPKNSFDKYTSAKQRRLFSECVEKIRWVNKLSAATTNLQGKDILEIEVFDIQLKKKADISELLTVIDRAIPYPIIFILRCDEEIMISTSQKHPNPADDNRSVIDWTFCAGWVSPNQVCYTIELRKDLDTVFQTFCKQVIGIPSTDKSNFAELISRERTIRDINSQITLLTAKIKSTKQFNQKVELNLELQQKLREIEKLLL